MKAVFLLPWGSTLRLDIDPPEDKRIGGSLEKDLNELEKALNADYMFTLEDDNDN